MSPATPSSRLTTIAASVVALVLAAGCTAATGSPIGSPGSAGVVPAAALPTMPPPPEPRNAWERALLASDGKGHYTKDQALTLFAVAFGPLPGVDVAQDLTGVDDRTIAIDEVHRHWAELTAEQRAAIDAAIAPSPGMAHASIGPAGSSDGVLTGGVEGGDSAFQGSVVDGVDATGAVIKSSAAEFRQVIASHLGFDIDGQFDVYWDLSYRPQASSPGALVMGQAWDEWPDGNFGRCTILIFATVSNSSVVQVRDTLAHELFHCFQYAGYGTLAAKELAPQWVLEGQAKWVGGALTDGASGSEGAFWYWYLQWPQRSLFDRKYDAIGFYEHLKETGTDPWTAFRAMWNAGGNDLAIFQASGADREDFYDSWASSNLRDAARGPAWSTDGFPGADPTSRYEPITIGMTGDTSDAFGAAYVTNDIRLYNVGADMVHISVEGHGRLSDGSIDTTALSDVWYCLDGHTCSTQCTSGTAPAIAGSLAPTFALAISGALDGTLATVQARDVKDVCSTPNPSPTGDEFCIRYKAMLDWAAPYQGDVTQPVAGEVAQRMRDARPFAPPQLLADVDLYIKVYGTFASKPKPINVPIVGPDAAGIADAFKAMNTYCGIPF